MYRLTKRYYLDLHKGFMKLKRAIYLGYYLTKLDREKFAIFLNHTTNVIGKSKKTVLSDLIKSVFKYNISILEYFQFRFFELSDIEREQWAGTGYMYEYQLAMNPKSKRHILDDKRQFYKKYGEFFVHKVADINDLANPEILSALLDNASGRLVFKVSDGKCGTEVEIRNSKEFTGSTIIPFMEQNNYGLVEEYIRQHPEINRLSPSAVNTVRIFTQVNRFGEVDILGCRFRISVDSPVDNMAAGNLAAPVDENTGLITGPAVYSDITRQDCEVHPITGVPILNFRIPFWNDIIDMVKRAALKHPQNRSIGWDVVVTEEGPGLIEGNHDWCKLLWQLPVKKGLKPMLEGHLKNASVAKSIEFEHAV